MAFLKMTWHSSLLNNKRKSGPPIGLKNLGNTCYINSVLQCLTYTPPLANFCLKFEHSSSCDSATEKKRECPFCLLEKRIARSLSIDSTLDSPLDINNCLRIFSSNITLGQQEDAHEFLHYVIDACHNTCLRLKKPQLPRKNGGSVSDSGNGNANTIVKEIFGGAMQSQVKCLSCGSESNKVDEIMDISLDILHSVSLKDALRMFFQPETLDGSNKYMCDNCKKLVPARKQMSILQAPNVLVIQMKRFEGIPRRKIDKSIAFEDVLVLSSYMTKTTQDLHPEYKLFGTIVHSGNSPDSGHYYAYIKDAMSRWYCCNDSYVSLSTLQEVLSEKVYILFFARSKQRPSTVKAGLVANESKCHDLSGNNMSKDKRSGQQQKGIKTKLLPDHSVSSNSVSSKMDKMPSGLPRKLGIFEHSNIKKPHANVNIKIIVHQKELFGKTCNPTNSSDTEGKRKNVNVLKDANSVSKVRRTTDSIDPKKVTNLSRVNGNCKNEHFGSDSSGRGLCENDTMKDNMRTGGMPKQRESSNGEAKCHSDRSGLKQESKDEKTSILDPTDFTTGQLTEHRELLNGNMECDDSSGLKRKLQDVDPSVLHAKYVPRGRTPEVKQFDGHFKCHSGISGLKKGAKDKDPCLLLAKDDQSCTSVDEFKKLIAKDASLVLRSCGWVDEVYNFMHSRKKFCIQEGKYDASKVNEMKLLLMAEAKSAFLSKVPESLKGDLIQQLVLFCREKPPS